MKKTKKMNGGCLYVFKGKSCSNTAYFETLDDAKLFLKLAQKKLKKYLYIHEYMLTQDGWVLLARLKSADRIWSAYETDQKQRVASDAKVEVWRIVSERIRLFLSEYVTKYNQRTGREGVLVKKSYERYYIETVQEAKQVIRKIRQREIGLQQTFKKYRAKRGHYSIPSKLGSGTIYLSSKRREKRRKRDIDEGRDVLEGSVFQLFSNKVVPKVLANFIAHTIKSHKTPIPDR